MYTYSSSALPALMLMARSITAWQFWVG